MTLQELRERAKEGLEHLRLLARPPERQLLVAAIDVSERDDCFILRADVPGATRRSTDLFLTDERTVLFRARRIDSADDDVADWGGRIVLPRPVNGDRVEATVANGVLTVALAKADGGRRRVRVRSMD